MWEQDWGIIPKCEFALPVSLSGLWLSLVSKGTVKCDEPLSTSLNIQHGSLTLADMSRRSLQLCWPTLWKLRWGLELSALVLSPLLDTFHCHLARREERRRERKEREGRREEEGREGRRETVTLPPHMYVVQILPTLAKFDQSDSRLHITSTIWLLQLQLLHRQAICNHFSPHHMFQNDGTLKIQL